MKKVAIFATLLILCAGAFGPTARAAPVGSTALWDVTTVDLTSPSRYYEVLQEIVAMEPGQEGPLRNGQQQYILNVLEGEVTILLGEKKSVYRKNQTAVIPAGINWWFGNEGDVRARFHETIINPPWQLGPARRLRPDPTNLGTVTTAIQRGAWGFISNAPSKVELTQQGADLDPGYRSSRQTANAFNILTVVSGEVTLRYDDGRIEKVAATKVTNLEIGKGVVIANEGSARTSYFMSWLAAPGNSLWK